MLYYAAYTWHAHTTAEAVLARHALQYAAGALDLGLVRGWYNLVGGGAGFLLLEADDPQAVTDLLQPYSDLMSFDVRAVVAVDPAELRRRLDQPTPPPA